MAGERTIVNEKPHPALERTFWISLYPDGTISRSLCMTKDEALDRCSWTGDKPDAEQVEVHLVPVKNET